MHTLIYICVATWWVCVHKNICLHHRENRRLCQRSVWVHWNYRWYISCWWHRFLLLKYLEVRYRNLAYKFRFTLYDGYEFIYWINTFCEHIFSLLQLFKLDRIKLRIFSQFQLLDIKSICCISGKHIKLPKWEPKSESLWSLCGLW